MKKGFTLIELLAVIVIIAIIALIAIPQISKVVDNAKESANLRSVEGHIGTLEYQFALNSDGISDGNHSFSDFTFRNYPSKDKIRCESYEIKKGGVVGASNCSVNNKYYCYSSSTGAYNCNGDSKASVHPVEQLASNRVREIRNTQNTDTSKRTGKIYYVSETGSDSNNGLSESTPLKTLDKLEAMFNNHEIVDGSTILFKDGDTFRGKLKITANDIMLGSYGDISKGKPNIYRSTHDGAKEGKWVKVKNNIWKYTLNGSDKVFTFDVGTVWGFCNKGNNNCNMSMRDYPRKFEYAQKILTNEDYDETNIESKIETLLKNDMEIYQTGHASRSFPKGEVLYIYSKEDPAKRFDEIEFNLSTNLIDATNYTDLTVDNLNIMFAGSHGIGTFTVANLTITNNEIAFIGGSKQKYEGGIPYRYGNAVQVWGGVEEKNGYSVKDGFVINNNYTYQVYDTGFTFQMNGEKIIHVEKAKFSNNVFDYMGAAIEYWIMAPSTKIDALDNSYVNDFIVDNNIFMRSGYGIVETRPNKDQFCFVSSRGKLLHIKGQLLFKDNIFYKGKLKFFWLHKNSNNFPTLVGNTFYGDDDIKFAILQDEAQEIIYDSDMLNMLYKGNTFKSLTGNEINLNNDSGTIGDLTWNYNFKSRTLTIDGSGDMPDYTESNKAPWSKYKDRIYNIIVGENVTKIGNYAFSNYRNLITLRINAKSLNNFSKQNSNDGNNYIFYNIGTNSGGVTLTFGPNVSRIPSMFLNPTAAANNNINIKETIFEGNNISEISDFGLAKVKDSILNIPEGVTKTGNMALSYNKSYLMILPNTLTSISDYAFNGDTYLERIVLGNNVNNIASHLFRRCENLKEIVMPHINDTTVQSNTVFDTTNTVTVYGDSSAQTWVNNMNTVLGNNKLVYKALSNYKPTITSNANINTTVAYNSSYTFTASGNVKVYYKFKSTIEKSMYGARKVSTLEIPVSKNGNTYTINNIKSDIYIEIK